MLLWAAVTVCCTEGALPESEAVPRTYSWDGELLAGVKVRVQKGDVELQPAIHALMHSAESLMKADISRLVIQLSDTEPQHIVS